MLGFVEGLKEPNEFDAYKRKCFDIYDPNERVFGKVEISVSLTQCPKAFESFDSGERLQKAIKKEKGLLKIDQTDEAVEKSRKSMELAGKSIGSRNSLKEEKKEKIISERVLEIEEEDQNEKNDQRTKEESETIAQNQSLNSRKVGETKGWNCGISKTISIQKMAEGYFCPPPMHFRNDPTKPVRPTDSISE